MTAKLHLTKSNPTLFNSLVTRGIKDVQVLSLRKSTPRELVSGISSLKSLNLSGCFNLSDLNIENTFCRDLKSLKTLDLSFCKDITDQSLYRISHFSKNLESIDLAGCSRITDYGLAFLANELKNLKDLNLRSCRQISDKGLQYLCNGSDSKLESLSLQDCQKLTDDSLRAIAEGMPNLKSINLSFCDVTDL